MPGLPFVSDSVHHFYGQHFSGPLRDHFGDLGIFSLLFVDDVVPLVSSGVGVQLTLKQFTGERK